MVELLKMVIGDYQAHIFLVLGLMYREQLKQKGTIEKQKTECNGRFQLLDSGITENKKDIQEAKDDQKEMAHDINIIKLDVREIKIRLDDKWGKNEEEKHYKKAEA